MYVYICAVGNVNLITRHVHGVKAQSKIDVC